MTTATNLATWNVAPGLRFALYNITLDSSYVGTTGEVVSLASEFPTEVFGAAVVSMNCTKLTTGHIYQYWRATSGKCSTGTIRVYIGSSAMRMMHAKTTGKSLASVDFYLMAWGR